LRRAEAPRAGARDRGSARPQATLAAAGGGGDPGRRGARAAGRLAVAGDLGSWRRDPDRDRRPAGRTPRSGRRGGGPRRLRGRGEDGVSRQENRIAMTPTPAPDVAATTKGCRASAAS